MMVLLLPFLLIRFVWSQAIQKQASTKTGKRCPMKLELNYKNLCEIPFNNAIKFPGRISHRFRNRDSEGYTVVPYVKTVFNTSLRWFPG